MYATFLDNIPNMGWNIDFFIIYGLDFFRFKCIAI